MMLSPHELHSIRQTLARVPRIEKAVLFGSRAMGTAKAGSDVDIAIMGRQTSLQDALRALSLLEESTLPYTFDIVCYNTINNPDLLRHIQEYGQVLFTGEAEPPRTD